jgi:hypothetical protein
MHRTIFGAALLAVGALADCYTSFANDYDLGDSGVISVDGTDYGTISL